MITNLSKLILVLFLIQLPAARIYSQKKKVSTVDSLSIDLNYVDKSFTVHARYFYQPKENVSDSVYFSLNPAFTITGISAPGLKEHHMTPKKGRPFPFRILKFEKPFNKQVIEINFVYAIKLSTLVPDEYNWIEMMVDQLWFPNANDIDNKFLSHVTVRNLPPDYMLYSYQSYKENPDHSYVIEERKPSIPEISFLAGKEMVIRKMETRGIQISYFTSKSTTDSTLNSIQAKMVDIIAYYNDTFGKSYLVTKFDIALRTAPRKIMSSQTTRDGLVITSVDFNTSYGNYAHEFGHFWWTGADFIREPWLNESFANLVMMKALRKFEPAQAERSYNNFKTLAETPGPVATAGTFDDNAYPRYYSKGCYLLLQLEEQIGEEKMDKFLELRARKKLHTTAQVLDALEKVTDKATRKAFEEKLKGN